MISKHIEYFFETNELKEISTVRKIRTVQKEGNINVLRDLAYFIDKNEKGYFGASLKDLGKKWFSFSKIDISSVKVLDKLKEKDVL